MSLGYFAQWIALVNHRPQLPGLNKIVDELQVFVGNSWGREFRFLGPYDLGPQHAKKNLRRQYG